MSTSTAHWACIGGFGGGDEPSLKEFDYNLETKQKKEYVYELFDGQNGRHLVIRGISLGLWQWAE